MRNKDQEEEFERDIEAIMVYLCLYKNELQEKYSPRSVAVAFMNIGYGMIMDLNQESFKRRG